MSTVSLTVSLPLDSDRFLRRECPLCHREFKVETTEDDRRSLVERELAAYLLEQGIETQSGAPEGTQSDEVEEESWCPYCGQTAPRGQWWTQEQVAYLHVFAHNIAAQIINDTFIRPMKREFSGRQSGFVSIKFEGKELEYEEPWISPEPDDMTIRMLPCCGLRVKVDDGWIKPVYCYKCGFQHAAARSEGGTL